MRGNALLSLEPESSRPRRLVPWNTVSYYALTLHDLKAPSRTQSTLIARYTQDFMQRRKKHNSTIVQKHLGFFMVDVKAQHDCADFWLTWIVAANIGGIICVVSGSFWQTQIA